MPDSVIIVEYRNAGSPTPSFDSTAGYMVGDQLYDTTNNILWKCLSNGAGAAVWLAVDDTTLMILALTGSQAAPVVNTWYNLATMGTLSATGRGRYQLVANVHLEATIGASANNAVRLEILLSNSATPGAGPIAYSYVTQTTINSAGIHIKRVPIVAQADLANSASLYIHARWLTQIGAGSVTNLAISAPNTSLQARRTRML